MSGVPKISVIIPAYNYGQFLGECLDSLLTQTFANWECVVIDNGSTDNTATVAKKYADKDKRFRYVYTEQSGVSKARNKAVELSAGEYILPLDADDKIASTYLEKAISIIEKNPNIKLVYCDAFLFGASSGKWTLPKYVYKNLLIENSIFCTALFRKKDFIIAGGYNENMKEGFEDWDFWIKFLNETSRVFKIEEPLFYYRIKENSRNTLLDNEKQLRLRQRIFENHKEKYANYFSVSSTLFEVYQLQTELNVIKNSKEFQLGKMIAKPLRFIKNIFNKK